MIQGSGRRPGRVTLSLAPCCEGSSLRPSGLAAGLLAGVASDLAIRVQITATPLMDKEDILKQTEEFVRKTLEGEGTGHDWWHILRVRQRITHHEKNKIFKLIRR